ncbi:MAG TPA: DUF4402 domain-containing protein [Bacteroidales bacterium]|nr:DUF4402 domain-containing protein [Bacteroidales bacterium]
MFRLKKTHLCLLLLLFDFSSLCFGQSGNPSTAMGHIVAEVITVYSATETAQMNFGRFAPGSEGGEIILTPSGTLSVRGNIYTGNGTHNAASFYISGDPNASFTVSLPQTPVFLKHISSSKTMMIEDWIANTGTGIGSGILEDGAQTVFVGATLKVGSLQDNPVGVYAGTYTISFDFN